MGICMHAPIGNQGIACTVIYVYVHMCMYVYMSAYTCVDIHTYIHMCALRSWCIRTKAQMDSFDMPHCVWIEHIHIYTHYFSNSFYVCYLNVLQPLCVYMDIIMHINIVEFQSVALRHDWMLLPMTIALRKTIPSFMFMSVETNVCMIKFHILVLVRDRISNVIHGVSEWNVWDRPIQQFILSVRNDALVSE